jgi:hypothetical protein
METIELELDDQELFRLMQLAHEQDITLNQLINNILQQVVDQHKEPDCDDGYAYKTAGFGTDEDYGGHHDRI